ncbi:MAG: ABC transporter ATP-binding protein [Bdellovibrio sp. ArHS]|uniref:rhodanese-like domain-containing protein n=1 Tax=Bdellovibrio sp. ArHS TaxID=1569284 RepID=UPI000583C7B4|nr:rhodanese-like domain-containing protein [Bdellovibrio sp. ArHS]KHD88144.1 MAG: ABC transporter ATP-binding protein [Bdellovibrio sp. ArHS]
MKNIFLLFAAVILFGGCQQKPTKVVSEEPVVGETLTAEKLIKGNPVLLDARPPFEFNLMHVPGAINVRWEDFSSQSPKSRGLLQGDLFALARRLSLIGVDPDTKVLVLGKGTQGMGEEGRIAWTLKVLGVKEVYTVLHTSYREMNTTREVPPVQNKPYWKPQVQEQLAVDFKTFKNQALSGGNALVILDVRSSQEFALRNLGQDQEIKTPVLNVHWTEFFDDKGLPAKKAERVLSEQNISKDTRILVLSNHGVRSGAVTYALQYLGYKKTANFAGGYEQWK